MLCGKHGNNAVPYSMVAIGIKSNCTMGNLLPKHDSNFHRVGVALRNIDHDRLLANLGNAHATHRISALDGISLQHAFYTMALLDG